MQWNKCNLPTSASMTVSKGAAGNVIVTLNSSICRRSTEKKNQILKNNLVLSSSGVTSEVEVVCL